MGGSLGDSVHGCWWLHFQFLIARPAGALACLWAVTSVLSSLWPSMAGKWHGLEGALASCIHPPRRVSGAHAREVGQQGGCSPVSMCGVGKTPPPFLAGLARGFCFLPLWG